MPISNEEWNAGRTWETLEARILTFLKRNQKPFNITEIISSLGYTIEIRDFWGFISSIANVWAVQNALETLVKEGTVEARIIRQPSGEQTYYKANIEV